MKYIIMCGGKYEKWDTPRQLTRIRGEPVVARTIRLLQDEGVTDIAISTHDMRFEPYAPLLKHDNDFVGYSTTGHWVDAFYPMDEPACYIMGDVVFSPDAIHTIVQTLTTDVEFFASAPPYSQYYTKPHAEPFAFKVVDQARFRKAVRFVRENEDAFSRRPIAWELWQVIRGHKLNHIDFKSYVAINDYTCDIDGKDDARKIEEAMNVYDTRVPRKRMVCQ